MRINLEESSRVKGVGRTMRGEKLRSGKAGNGGGLGVGKKKKKKKVAKKIVLEGDGDALDLLERPGYGVYDGYPHPKPWMDILEEKGGGEEYDEEEEEKEEEGYDDVLSSYQTPLPPPPPGHKKNTKKKGSTLKKKDASRSVQSRSSIPRPPPSSISRRSHKAPSIPLPVDPKSIRTFDPSDSYLKHITFHEARKEAEKPMREAVGKVKVLMKRIAVLEERLRKVLRAEEEEKANMVPRVIRGWLNRYLMGGFRKWRNVVEGMVKGDAMSLYRGVVIKTTLKGLVRKYLRRGFDAMIGDRGRESKQEKGRDEYLSFGGNLTWTEVPPGSFID